jgi:membrane-associated phospholipid phosphatase
MQQLAHASWSQRIRHFLFNALAFALCYPVTNYLAQMHHITRDVAIHFDANIPFLAWMIIPYLCSGLLFLCSFMLMPNQDELRVLSQRMLLATIIASLCFVFYPLRFSTARPDIASPLFAALFDYLALFDRPYNQLPSLHVAYCLIFWHSLVVLCKNDLMKIILAACLLLVALSTLFSYQHHLLDVVAGALLGLVVMICVRPQRKVIPVAFYYASIASIVFIIGVKLLHSWLAVYLVLSLLLVSLAYLRKNRHFLHKIAGRHSIITYFCYAPYLLGYWLTWRAVRYRERKQPAFKKYANQLWIGRRLSQIELKLLPENCVTIDLSPELSEIRSLSAQNYRHFPLLDLLEPDTKVMAEIADTIQNEIQNGRNIYLHCAMGYHRCIAVATYTMANIKS